MFFNTASKYSSLYDVTDVCVLNAGARRVET